MLQSILETAESVLVGKVEKCKAKPSREKHFNTIAVTLICLILAQVPLSTRNNSEIDRLSTVSFRSIGTLMHVGTQPFVSASFVHSLIVDNPRRNQSHICGFLLSLIQSLQWGVKNTKWGGFQLSAMSYLLLRAVIWLEGHGSIGLSTALIFATASQQLLLSVTTPLVFVWTVLLLIVVIGLENVMVTVPLVHQKTKHQISMSLPLLYNSTTALILYFTVVESLVSVVPSAAFLNTPTVSLQSIVGLPCMFGILWRIDQQLPQLQQTTATTVVNKWQKQSYFLKGWRKTGATRYVHRIIVRNIQWSSCIVFLLWLLGTLLRPAFGITTLFIVVSTARQFESEKWQVW